MRAFWVLLRLIVFLLALWMVNLGLLMMVKHDIAWRLTIFISVCFCCYYGRKSLEAKRVSQTPNEPGAWDILFIEAVTVTMALWLYNFFNRWLEWPRFGWASIAVVSIIGVIVLCLEHIPDRSPECSD